MRIAVTRTGGLAGITRRAELDTEDRPGGARLAALARAAVAPAGQTPPRGVPDGFAYQITVDGRTVHCADPALTGAQRELIRTVLGEGA